MAKQTSSSSAPAVLKEGEPTTRIHIWLYAADVEWIDQHVDAVKRSKFIRLALRKVIRNYQERAERQAARALKLDELEREVKL